MPGWNASYCSVGLSLESSFNQSNLTFSHRAFRDLRHFLRIVAERVSNLSAPDQRCIIVVTGTLGGAYRIVKALWESGLRQRIVIVLHFRVHRVPLHPDCRNLFDRVDAIVTESTFGTNSVRSVYKDQGLQMECPFIQIPPGFDASQVADATQQHRQRERKEFFGVEDDTLLIGCWLDGPDHRLGLAMHIFRVLAKNAYWKCLQCGTFNVSRINPELLNLIPCDRCSKCHHENQELTRLSPKMHLHVMSPIAIRDEWSILIDYRAQMNLQQYVSFDQSEGAFWIHDQELLAKRFGALDIYFLPADGAALHPSLQHASAAGIPCVTTAFGEAAEYLDSHVRLVRVASWQLHSLGYLQAQLDVADAVQTLLELSRSKTTRQLLGQSARAVTEGMQWEFISRRWSDELRGLQSRIESKRRVTPSGGA